MQGLCILLNFVVFLGGLVFVLGYYAFDSRLMVAFGGIVGVICLGILAAFDSTKSSLLRAVMALVAIIVLIETVDFLNV